MMAIDDLLDRARDAKRRRDEAATELGAVTRALDGLKDAGILDDAQQRELARLKQRAGRKRATGRRMRT